MLEYAYQVVYAGSTLGSVCWTLTYLPFLRTWASDAAKEQLQAREGFLTSK
jgi:hypothetical protein